MKSLRLKAESRDVLEPTEIDGITAFGATSLTVRTSTRVRPGRHEGVANQLRLAIKEAFDREAEGPTKTWFGSCGSTSMNWLYRA